MKLLAIFLFPFLIQEIEGVVRCFCDSRHCEEALCSGDWCIVGFKGNGTRLVQKCGKKTSSKLKNCKRNWKDWDEICSCNADFCNTFNFLRRRMRDFSSSEEIEQIEAEVNNSTNTTSAASGENETTSFFSSSEEIEEIFGLQNATNMTAIIDEGQTLLNFTSNFTDWPWMEQEACDKERLLRCTNSLALSLGFPAFPTDNPFVLYDSMAKFLQKGLAGLEELCGKYKAFESCLGAEFNACVSARNLMKEMGLSGKSAGIAASVFTQWTYLCGAGYKVFMRDLPCFGQVWGARPVSLQACIYKFVANITRDPRNICRYWQNYADCYSGPFSLCGAEGEEAVCKFSSAPSQSAHCRIRCGPKEDHRNLSAGFCDKKNFLRCSNIYATRLGLPSFPRNPWRLYDGEAQKMYKGAEGLKEICRAYKELRDCLGDQYDDCVATWNFMGEMGLSRADAGIAHGVFAQLGYKCGAGYQVFMRDWPCMGGVWGSKPAELQGCTMDFIVNITGPSPSPMHLCDSWERYAVECYSPPFGVCGAQARRAVCELIASPGRPGCRFSCNDGPQRLREQQYYAAVALRSEASALVKFSSLLFCLCLILLEVAAFF